MGQSIWITSDLQLSNVDRARQVLRNAVDDILSLNLDLVEVWCLGDALVGANLDQLEAVADECVTSYESLGVPICYVMGNHEMDLRRGSGLNRYPLYERVQQRSGWHTMQSSPDHFFAREVLGHTVFFMGDHASEDGTWYTTSGTVRGEKAENYPHMQLGYLQLREAIARSTRPVITVSHYAFRGGQRPSALLDPLLPLPSNVRAHFHGHAHIGDLIWNGDDPWERVHPITSSRASQFNVSALETERSPGSHSAVLTFCDDGSLRIQFRCHEAREWLEQHEIPPEGSL